MNGANAMKQHKKLITNFADIFSFVWFFIFVSSFTLVVGLFVYVVVCFLYSEGYQIIIV